MRTGQHFEATRVVVGPKSRDTSYVYVPKNRRDEYIWQLQDAAVCHAFEQWFFRCKKLLAAFNKAPDDLSNHHWCDHNLASVYRFQVGAGNDSLFHINPDIRVEDEIHWMVVRCYCGANRFAEWHSHGQY